MRNERSRSALNYLLTLRGSADKAWRKVDSNFISHTSVIRLENYSVLIFYDPNSTYPGVDFRHPRSLQRKGLGSEQLPPVARGREFINESDV